METVPSVSIRVGVAAARLPGSRERRTFGPDYVDRHVGRATMVTQSQQTFALAIVGAVNGARLSLKSPRGLEALDLARLPDGSVLVAKSRHRITRRREIRIGRRDGFLLAHCMQGHRRIPGDTDKLPRPSLVTPLRRSLMTARTRVTRRSFLAGCSFTAAAALLAACGPAPSEQVAAKQGSTPAANSQPASSAGAPAAAGQPTSAPAAAAASPATSGSPVASGSPAASGSPVAQAPAAAPAAQAAPGQATTATIQFMDWDPVEGTPYEKVINEYTRQTGRKVQIIPTPGSGPEYETKVRTMLAGGVAPDIMRL